MQWYVSRRGEVEGPMDAAAVRRAIETGAIDRSVHVRDEGGQWTPIEQSPFSEMLAGSRRNAGNGDGLGYAVLLIPLLGVVLIWLWVARMNLLQGPSGALAAVSFGTVGICAILIAVEASQLGMGKVANSKGKKDSGPVAWFLATFLVFVIVHPWYLAARGKYGRKSLVVGGALTALAFSGSVLLLGVVIEDKKSSARRSLNAAMNQVPPVPSPQPSEPSVADRLGGARNLREAISLIRPYMTDTQGGEMPPAAAALGLWSRERMLWAELEAMPDSRRADVMKNPDSYRGARICTSGQIIEIQADNSVYPPVFAGGLMTRSLDMVRFLAVRSTGDLVAEDVARFCGIITGLQSYPNAAGGITHAVYVVGMFDLPENRASGGGSTVSVEDL